MDLFASLDINNTLVNIPIGDGYAMSWIEAFGTVFGLLCIWFASQEKTINYVFGLLNVTLFCCYLFPNSVVRVATSSTVFLLRQHLRLVRMDSTKCTR